MNQDDNLLPYFLQEFFLQIHATEVFSLVEVSTKLLLREIFRFRIHPGTTSGGEISERWLVKSHVEFRELYREGLLEKIKEELQ